VYAAIFIDKIMVKVRDGQVGKKPVYAAIGVDLDGHMVDDRGQLAAGITPDLDADAARAKSATRSSRRSSWDWSQRSRR
jgi:hypothetical protein